LSRSRRRTSTSTTEALFASLSVQRYGKPALAAALIALTIGAASEPASAATTSAGQLYAFGLDRYGQLGSTANNGSENPNPTPTLVNLPGAHGPLTEIAVGRYHSLAVTESGQLYAFGENRYGELGSTAGNGSENPNPTPTLVNLPGANGPVVRVAAGEYYSLALTSSGQLYAFGRNEWGQLGSSVNEGTNNPNPTPTQVGLPGANAPVTEIAAGAAHVLALTASGQLYAFGDNAFGQLGSTADFIPNPTPAAVSLPGASGPVTEIAAGGDQSLVLTASGQLYAFGFNAFGELGNTTNNGTANPNPIPTPVILPGAVGPVTEIVAGGDHSLVLTASGQLYAFGQNFFGELGLAANGGTLNANPTPALVTLPGASGPVLQIAAGLGHSLALTASGQLYAFGDNLYGELGRTANVGTTNANPTPAPVDLPAGTTIDTVAHGGAAFHVLAMIADLRVANGSLPSGRVDTRYAASAAAEGGSPPYAWRASGLPDGISLDAAGGQIGGTPTAAGTAQVVLSVSDRFGIVANGAPLALRTAPPLTISRLRQSHRRWRKGRRPAKLSKAVTRRRGRRAPLGTRFTFRLSENATVRFAFARRRGKRFRKAAALTFAGRQGKNRVAFQGRVSRRKRLRPGRYRLTATATAPSDGARSKPRSLRFTIVR
jgi:alpha-tubulin suppressor-like RCC1 family protein